MKTYHKLFVSIMDFQKVKLNQKKLIYKKNNTHIIFMTKRIIITIIILISKIKKEMKKNKI